MKLWDTHCHITDEVYDGDRLEVLERAAQVGLIALTTVLASPAGWRRASAVEGVDVPHVYLAAGVHPHSAQEIDLQDLSTLRSTLALPACVALGEIGLDYHYDFAPRSVQKAVFVAQLCLAAELELPILLHEREATSDLLEILESVGVPTAGGVWHCFSGGVETAQRACELGLILGFGGLVTFRRGTEELREAVRWCPSDRFVLETDAPYLAPVPHRGKRNEPAWVREVAHFVAGLRGQDLDDVCQTTTQNAKRLFSRARWET